MCKCDNKCPCRKPHPHAQLMADYAQDALETDEPWKLWEFYSKGSSGWVGLNGHPVWLQALRYRRKTKTININGYEVPEPMRCKPSKGELYYVPDFGKEEGFYALRWSGSPVASQLFNAGLCHDSEKAAILHGKALLSFTEG